MSNSEYIKDVYKLSREIFIHNPDFRDPEFSIQCAQQYMKALAKFVETERAKDV